MCVSKRRSSTENEFFNAFITIRSSLVAVLLLVKVTFNIRLVEKWSERKRKEKEMNSLHEQTVKSDKESNKFFKNLSKFGHTEGTTEEFQEQRQSFQA